MSLPEFPSISPAITREEAINQIISSIAMEELGLSHIINAEGEKLQYVLGTIPGISGPAATIEDVLEVNESVRAVLQSAAENQTLLRSKLQAALSSPVMKGPTGPSGPRGPVSIKVREDVENLDPGTDPYVRNWGTEDDLDLEFGIPRGETGTTGATGADGRAATVDVLRNVIPVPYGGQPYVLNRGTETAAVLEFALPMGPQGEKGDDGAQGEKGETGPAGPTGPILMPFANSQMGTQTVPDKDGKVVFENEYTTLNGIAFNGTDTFTVGDSGIYVLQCVLNSSPDNTEASAFSLYVNGRHLVVSGAESGQIMIGYVGHLDANSEIQILNANYGKSTKISQVYGFQGSAGHIIIYKIADSGVDIPS